MSPSLTEGIRSPQAGLVGGADPDAAAALLSLALAEGAALRSKLDQATAALGKWHAVAKPKCLAALVAAANKCVERRCGTAALGECDSTLLSVARCWSVDRVHPCKHHKPPPHPRSTSGCSWWWF